jgi:hypothetical protein
VSALLYHRDQMYRVGWTIGRGVGEEISGARNTTMKLEERGQPQDTGLEDDEPLARAVALDLQEQQTVGRVQRLR